MSVAPIQKIHFALNALARGAHKTVNNTDTHTNATSYEFIDIVIDDDDGKKITFLNTTQLHVYVHVHAR